MACLIACSEPASRSNSVLVAPRGRSARVPLAEEAAAARAQPHEKVLPQRGRAELQPLEAQTSAGSEELAVEEAAELPPIESGLGPGTKREPLSSMHPRRCPHPRGAARAVSEPSIRSRLARVDDAADGPARQG